MIKKIFINIILILIVFLTSQSWLAFFWPFLNLFLPLIVFVLMFFDNKFAIFWSVSAGFLLDSISPLPFGSYLLFFCLIFLILKYLNQNFFTNRSLGTFFTLNLVANFLLLAFLFLEKRILWFSGNSYFISFSLRQILIQVIFSSFICFILFFITKFFTSRIRLDLLSH